MARGVHSGSHHTTAIKTAKKNPIAQLESESKTNAGTSILASPNGSATAPRKHPDTPAPPHQGGCRAPGGRGQQGMVGRLPHCAHLRNLLAVLRQAVPCRPSLSHIPLSPYHSADPNQERLGKMGERLPAGRRVKIVKKKIFYTHPLQKVLFLDPGGPSKLSDWTQLEPQNPPKQWSPQIIRPHQDLIKSPNNSPSRCSERLCDFFCPPVGLKTEPKLLLNPPHLERPPPPVYMNSFIPTPLGKIGRNL